MSPTGYPKAGRRPQPHPEPEVKEEQCLYCSLYFQDVVGHQQLVHKGEKPTERTPETPESIPAGGIWHPPVVPGQVPPPPFKKRWSYARLERGYICSNAQCDYEKITESTLPSRELPEHEGVCPKCSGIMKHQFPTVEYEPPRNMQIGYGGLVYYLVGDQVNLVPSVIMGTARQSLAEERKGLVRQDSDRPIASVRKLETPGFMPPLEEDKSF